MDASRCLAISGMRACRPGWLPAPILTGGNSTERSEVERDFEKQEQALVPQTESRLRQEIDMEGRFYVLAATSFLAPRTLLYREVPDRKKIGRFWSLH